jgi:integrase
MASVVNDPGGRRRILFVAPDGARKTVRLGKIDRRSAETVRRHIEALLAAQIAGLPCPRDTAVWLTSLGEPLRDRLARAGLIPRRDEASRARLGAFCGAYLGRRTDIKPASLLALQQAARNLCEFFGENRLVDTITAGDAADFHRWLATAGRADQQSRRRKRSPGLAPATIGKRLSRAREIFTDALKRQLIRENPFDGIKSPRATNPARQVYVPASVVERLIETTPDHEWKLLLAMARYLGVRVPSEPFSLTWADVDWERGRIRLPSPKTAVHGKEYRVVPLVPEVRQHLEAVWDAAPEGATYVFSRLRERASTRQAEKGFWQQVNLRQYLLRLIKRAGLTPWPKLFANLRASAQTDLADRFPAHVVCSWLGNSGIVAARHYLQVTDAHFEAAQKAAQQPHATRRMITQQQSSTPQDFQ